MLSDVNMIAHFDFLLPLKIGRRSVARMLPLIAIGTIKPVNHHRAYSACELNFDTSKDF